MPLVWLMGPGPMGLLYGGILPLLLFWVAVFVALCCYSCRLLRKGQAVLGIVQKCEDEKRLIMKNSLEAAAIDFLEGGATFRPIGATPGE